MPGDNEVEIIGDFTVKKLDPKIWVFGGAIKNPDKLVDYYVNDPINVDRWVPWYTFGDMISDNGPGLHNMANFPTKEEWMSNFEHCDDPYKVQLANAFYDASDIYVRGTEATLDNWESPNWGIARYFPDVEDFSGGRTMQYHTDYQQDRKEYPGPKNMITAVGYPNDDYEGGEISFRIVKEGTKDEVEREIIYKPEAGDLVIFPSVFPYYHGVLNVKKNPKYIIRFYWNSLEEATEDYEYFSNKYKENWDQLELVRRKRDKAMVEDPVLRLRMSMREYYEMLEAGTLDDYFDGL